MKKPIRLSVPEPCHEKWAAMTPAEKGRYCAACQRNVRDFTLSSDGEILRVLKTEDKICGRFHNSQLDRNLIAPKDKKSFFTTAGIAATLALLTIGNSKIYAQTPVNTEQHELKTDDIKPLIKESLKKITGTITDEYDMPVPGVNVKIAGSGKPAVQTDFDGAYTIEASDRDKLEFTYIGMEMQVITVGVKTNYNIIMKQDTEMTLGIVVYERAKPRLSVAWYYMFDL